MICNYSPITVQSDIYAETGRLPNLDTVSGAFCIDGSRARSFKFDYAIGVILCYNPFSVSKIREVGTLHNLQAIENCKVANPQEFS